MSARFPPEVPAGVIASVPAIADADPELQMVVGERVAQPGLDTLFVEQNPAIRRQVVGMECVADELNRVKAVNPLMNSYPKRKP